MGLFGSIGSVVGGALGSYFGPVGTTVGAGLGNSLGGALDGPSAKEKAYNEQLALAKSGDAFNRAYIQNQLQWRVADAKKAGLHPMAVLGLSSPQYSAPSLPSIDGLSSDSSIDPMEFGQSLNYAAAKAKDRDQQQQMVNLQLKGLELDNEYKQAQIDQMKVDTLASSIVSNQGLQGPAAPPVNSKTPNGLPTAPEKGGYVGDPEVQFMPTASDPNVFNLHPGSDFSAVWEDKDIAGLIPLDLWPIIKANSIDYLSRLRGKIVNGMVYSNTRGGWVSINGPYGKEALADRLGLGNLAKSFSITKKVLNPSKKDNFSPSDYAKRFYVNY